MEARPAEPAAATGATPKAKWTLATWLATGFGLGLSPLIPGTVGSLPGLALVLAMGQATGGPGLLWRAAAAAGLALLAIPICDAAEKQFGKKDDRRIVADEYLTFPICVLGIPWTEHLWFLGVAFVVNRICDTVKPPPARQLQRVKGGLGIVIDDVFACLYALAINHAIWRLYGM
jgi:phosphatidylglycerophosphatase A